MAVGDVVDADTSAPGHEGGGGAVSAPNRTGVGCDAAEAFGLVVADEGAIVLLDDDAPVRLLDDAQFSIGDRALAAVAFQLIERPLLGRSLSVALADFFTSDAAAIAWRHLLRSLRLRGLDTGCSNGRGYGIKIAAPVAITVARRPRTVGRRF